MFTFGSNNRYVLLKKPGIVFDFLLLQPLREESGELQREPGVCPGGGQEGCGGPDGNLADRATSDCPGLWAPAKGTQPKKTMDFSTDHLTKTCLKFRFSERNYSFNTKLNKIKNDGKSFKDRAEHKFLLNNIFKYPNFVIIFFFPKEEK